MSVVTAIVAARIIALKEEGFRADVYDDATGQPIACQGQPTIAYGCRCRQWSKSLGVKVLNCQLEEKESPLYAELWYVGCNDARRSALLEIAFNQGDAGLEDGYPHMVAAVAARDWPEAQAQCTVREPELAARYAMLGEILLTGTLP